MRWAEGHQLPDPTTVTLCFCSCEPRVAIFLATDRLGFTSSSLEVCEVRIEAEMLARRRRADPRRVAILAVMAEDLEAYEARYSLND